MSGGRQPDGGSLLGHWASWASRCPGTVILLAVLLAALGLVAAAWRLELRTSNLDLVAPSLPPVARFLDFAETFGTPNQAVVVLEGDDPAALAAAVDALGPTLRRATGVKAVLDKKPLDPDALAILGIDPYFTSRDRGLFFIFVQPEDTRSEALLLAPFVAAVEAVIDRRLAAPDLAALGVRAGLTGMPRYAIDDRDVIQRDMSRLSGLALMGVLVLFASSFGALRRPLAAVAALVLAIAWTVGIVAFVPGHLTLLSSFFAAILAGLGIDFGIHLVDRIEERIARGEVMRAAAPGAVRDLSRPLATGGATTAAVLFSMAFSGFRGFAELGVVAGVGVLACLLSMVVVLPAVLCWGPVGRGAANAGRRRLGGWLLRLQHRSLAVLVAIAALISILVGPAPFDSDYLNLQPHASEAVRLERAMVARSDLSPGFAVFVAPDVATMRDLTWRLADDETVGSVRSMQSLGGLGGLPAGDLLGYEALASLRAADGRYAIYAFPAEDIWQPAAQHRFLAAMRAIDPAVTGMPMLGDFMIARTKRALGITMTLGSSLLVLSVWVGFRRLVPTLLALLPTALTVLSLHASMRVFGMAWNPLNVMALPIVLGIAVDDGVHVVHRFLAEGGDLARTLAGTGRSVTLTSATTLVAFGALILTEHRGLGGFAGVVVLGVSAAWLQSVLVLPQVLLACRRSVL